MPAVTLEIPRAFCDRIRQPPDDGAVLWRYMNLHKLVWMISKKQLWFNPISLFEDKFEGRVPTPMLERARADFERRGQLESHFPEHRRQVDQARHHFHVSCWHIGDVECQRMWDDYCGSRDGVALKTTYGALRRSLQGFPIGHVEYIEPDAFEDPSFQFSPLYSAWLKRKEFAHEKEIRVGYFEGWMPGWRFPTEYKRYAFGSPIEWDPVPLIDSVVVHPRADWSYVEAVMEVLKMWAPSKQQCVQWSTLSTWSEHLNELRSRQIDSLGT
jgi:hypothetical protein